MNDLRFFLMMIVLMMFWCAQGWAQEDNVMTATSTLQSVLTNLKQSVQKLTFDNNQLASREDLVKKQIDQLQMQLEHLEAQGEFLNKGVAKLKSKDPDRVRQITDLEGKNAQLDYQIQHAASAINVVQQSLDAGDEQLQAGIHRQKEKLRLMEMIHESQERQEALQKSILKWQRSNPSESAAKALEQQQFLKAQIKNLQQQIAISPQEKVSAHQWDDAHLGQLETQVKSLEQNYSQLKDLIEQMIKKAQASLITASQHAEEVKLQNSLDDLNRQRIGLLADLSHLRSVLIDLDKRKSRLETMIQP